MSEDLELSSPEIYSQDDVNNIEKGIKDVVPEGIMLYYGESPFEKADFGQ